MAVLARVVNAVSSIQKWPREQWSVEIDENGRRSFRVSEDPMPTLRSAHDSYDPQNPYEGNEERYLEERDVYLESASRDRPMFQRARAA